MSVLAKLQSQNIQTQDEDRVGGLIPTGLYPAVIKVAFLDTNEKGTVSVTLDTALLVNGAQRDYKETFYITGQGGRLTYTDKKTGKEMPQMGFTKVDAICKLATGKSFNEMTGEMKAVKVYNFETKQEEVVQREVLSDLTKTSIMIAIEEQVVDKTADNGSGKWMPTGETRSQNEIIKVYNAEGFTSQELANKVPEPIYGKQWATKFSGVVRNKAKGAGQANGVKQGSPSGQATQAASLI